MLRELVLCFLFFFSFYVPRKDYVDFAFTGEAPGNQRGRAVQINGSGAIVAISSPFVDVPYENAGEVKVYQRNKGYQWTQLGNTIVGMEPDELFGSSLSINQKGDVLAIGAPFNSKAAYYAGQVRVYKLSGGRWSPLGNVLNGEFANDIFGSSVQLNAKGDRLAVSAPFNDIGGEDSGCVKVYELGKEGWKLLGRPLLGSSSGEQSGAAISFSANGERLAIAAPMFGENRAGYGKVTVYEISAEKLWQPIGKAVVGDKPRAYFGSSISLNAQASLMAVSAPFGKSNNKSGSGMVQLYRLESGGIEKLNQNISGAGTGNLIGNSVALSGDGSHLAIGAPLSFNRANGKGKVLLYQLDKNGGIVSREEIHGQHQNELFGNTVGINQNGTSIIIGAPFNNDDGEKSGRATFIQYPVKKN
nr:hypothetical protein [uncultured Allomuricauda sp.]